MNIKKLYSIGEKRPINQNDINDVERRIPFSLPNDYKEFLKNYGSGNINELIMVILPNEEYVKVNFVEYLDLWGLSESEKQIVINGFTISTTIDGDIVVVVNDKRKPVIVLPRDSSEILRFENFNSIIDYYCNRYQFSDLYFDTDCNFELAFISFMDSGKFDQSYHNFIENISFDKVYNAGAQAKYVIQKIGGWVYFDGIYKSSIRIKSQTQFKDEAERIIGVIKK